MPRFLPLLLALILALPTAARAEVRQVTLYPDSAQVEETFKLRVLPSPSPHAVLHLPPAPPRTACASARSPARCAACRRNAVSQPKARSWRS